MITWKDLPRPKSWRGEPVKYVQEKLNGIRILVRRTDDVYDAYTRNGKTNHFDILRVMGILPKYLPPFTAYDCELWLPGGHETDVSHYIAEQKAGLRLSIFAVPFLKGEDLRANGSAHLYDEEEDILPKRPYELESEEMLLEEARTRKIEGFVLKTDVYGEWYKVKPVKTIDLIVTGYTISRSDTHWGGIRGLKMSLYHGDEIANVGSGFEADWRMSVDPKKLIGKIAEIEYQDIHANGRLKFPRFLRWRDDKQPHECGKEQLNG